MAINLVIAVTDGDWFDMLRQQQNLAEVNFWAPSAANFRALQPGELFLFKLHAPRNMIVVAALFVAALSVAGSIFLILEMDQPYGGFIKIRSDPLRSALEQLGRP